MCEMGSCTQCSELTHETPSVCLKMQYLGLNQSAHLIHPVRLFRHTQACARRTSADLKIACLFVWLGNGSLLLFASFQRCLPSGRERWQSINAEGALEVNSRKQKKGKSVSHHRQILWPSSAVASLDAQSLLLIAAHLFQNSAEWSDRMSTAERIERAQALF